ncbi:MAG TPA: ImmA/IrrE family metallo-endopeptidase, partial [Giesbergeria sp.]|nr:ImmA/IrrE family metallo-endopeptidase [Giesbergeria sp.]
EPITIQGEAMDPEFEGALFNLNADAPGKGNWAIIYNQAISSPGRIRFTLAHELGHYLVHRHLQTSFNCSEVDTTQWDSDERKIESEANTFASYLLMPADDYRRQIQGATIDLDVLGACADRYGVSMTSAILKWLELTPQRAVLVMSQNGVVQWACGSESGKWLSMHLNKRLANGQRRPVPAMSATRLDTDTKVDRLGTAIDARIWFAQEPEGMVAREMRIASDFYRQTMTLLVLPPEVKPWERDKTDDDDDGLENTFDRFVRKGQPPVR